MATNDTVLGNAGTRYHTQQTHYLVKVVNYNDANISSVSVGVLPPGAVVRRAAVVPSVAFNAGTTNTINIGNATLATAYGSALALGAIADVAGTVSTAHLTTTASVPVIAVVSMTGAAATAGTATIIIEFVVTA